MTLNMSVTDDQLGKYTRRVAAIADRLEKSLPYEEVMEVLQRIHDGEFGEQVAQARATKPRVALLERLGTVMVGPTTKPFVAREKLVVDTSPKARVKISFVSDIVADWWLAGEGWIEEPIAECDLAYDRLRKASVDGPIIAELGGVVPAKVSWTEAYEIMARQPNGRKAGASALRVDGWWNLFYIPQTVTKLEGNAFNFVNRAGHTVTEEVSNTDYLFEEDGQWYVLRAVRVRWRGDGWGVGADSVEHPLGWNEDGRVFSRNSRVLESLDTVASA